MDSTNHRIHFMTPPIQHKTTFSVNPAASGIRNGGKNQPSDIRAEVGIPGAYPIELYSFFFTEKKKI